MSSQEFFHLLFSNHVLMAGVAGWFSAQTLKTIIYAILNHKLDLTRFFGDGGMPSAHSSTVSCMATAACIFYGIQSFEFAISAMLAFITMRDAMGVRLETGKQAKIINELMSLWDPEDHTFSEERLKEFVGHTPVQVFCGGVLGIVVAISLYYFVG